MDRAVRTSSGGCRGTFLVVAVALGLLTARASATWSIIMYDTRTHEIVVGAATCVTGIDLKEDLPVVLVDHAAACAQALVDVFGTNRQYIHDRLLENVAPSLIIDGLAQLDSVHQRRQYGIVSAVGAPATFTGSETFAFAGGLTGADGDRVYAIQGNILTGQPVLLAAEQAVRNTQGSMPEKLMAAMEAARAMGGDGRCSCSPAEPTSCGSPPPSFEKAAHVGFMIAARTGDTDGGCGAADGCATGDYFMDFNIPYRGEEETDPVISLREEFDVWFAGLIGWPDAFQSTATVEPPAILADGAGSATMTITLRDIQGNPLDDAQLDQITLAVLHAPDSSEASVIGPIVPAGGGVYHVELIGTDAVGRDRYFVRAEGPFRPVIVAPVPELLSVARADLDADGDVDRSDYGSYAICLTGPSTAGEPCAAADLDANGQVDLPDYKVLQNEFTGSSCRHLQVLQEPQSQQLPCGYVLSLRVVVDADPPAVFQWSLNGEPIPGATRSRYTANLTSAEDYGTYSVEIRNTCGSTVVDGVEVAVRGIPCP